MRALPAMAASLHRRVRKLTFEMIQGSYSSSNSVSATLQPQGLFSKVLTPVGQVAPCTPATDVSSVTFFSSQTEAPQIRAEPPLPALQPRRPVRGALAGSGRRPALLPDAPLRPAARSLPRSGVSRAAWSASRGPRTPHRPESASAFSWHLGPGRRLSVLTC